MPDNSCELSNNLFFNILPKGKNTITDDPLFVQAGTVDTDIDMNDPNRLLGYKLKDNSPCIDAGIAISDNGGKDFWGNKVESSNIDIGAFEK